MAFLTAVIVDCTSAPGTPPGAGKLTDLARCYDELDVMADVVQLSDGAVAPGAGAAVQDEWSVVVEKLVAADIVVIGLPSSAGDRRGVADLVIERVSNSAAPGEIRERYPLFNKVGAVVAPADDDSASLADMLARLAVLGCTAAPGTDMRSLASSTVHLARVLRDNPLPLATEDTNDEKPLPRKLFGNVPTGSSEIDPEALEAERRAAEEGRLIDRRRTFDLTRREKGLPENRKLPRPPFAPPSGDRPES